MEEARLFEHMDIPLTVTELKTTRLSDEAPLVDNDGLSSNNRETLKSKLLKYRLKEALCAFILVFFVVLLILGIGITVYIINNRSLLQQQELSRDPKLHLKNTLNASEAGAVNISKSGPRASTRPESVEVSTVNMSGRNEELNVSNMSEVAPLSNASNTIRNVSEARFSCFSPWFTRLRSCYLFSIDSKTWMEAQASCVKEDGQLVQIEDNAENMYVRLNAGTFYHDFWVGLSYQRKNHGWVWNQNKFPVMSSDYTSWASGHAQNKHNDGSCVALTRNSEFLWDVRHCNVKNRYICEKNTSSESFGHLHL